MGQDPEQQPKDTPAEVVFVPPRAEEITFWMRHRLSLLLIITISIAVTLTVVSMVIYTQSGAAQLDLSRPGYKSVSNQVEVEDTTDAFSASGPIDKETIEEFMTMYDKQVKNAKSVDAFNGDPLNPEVLF